MIGRVAGSRLRHRLISQLYMEAMLLADEARSYFDANGGTDRDVPTALARVAIACESLKVTTRLMHVIAWLLTQRAVLAGEVSAGDALDATHRLGSAPATDDRTVATLPQQARAMVAASIDLHERVARLDGAWAVPAPSVGPARSMQDRLASVF